VGQEISESRIRSDGNALEFREELGGVLGDCRQEVCAGQEIVHPVWSPHRVNDSMHNVVNVGA